MPKPAHLIKDNTKPEAERSPARIQALDFTKGALVLFMVLYHWLVYFHGPYGLIFRYLRFLPPSFIFITGFLISNAYLAKYKTTDSRLVKRLVIRGLKVLAIFVILNLGINILSGFRNLNFSSLFAVFVTGNVFVAGFGKAAAFYVLVPISYLLVLSTVLLIIHKSYRNIFYVVLILCLAVNLVLNFEDFPSSNLELVTIGLLGLSLGEIPIVRINSFIRKYPYAIILAYLSYIAAITLWEPNYAAQIVGVGLTLMLIYLIGMLVSKPSGMPGKIVLLGKYPLFGYIAQIAVLQLMRGSLRYIHMGFLLLILTFIAATALTFLAVMAIDRTRMKSMAINRVYAAIFA